ncbi:MAG TPA: Ig-like domain-containing protein [Ohtaekwangia sp.]|uniref:Ig-like domain-containing protein n=1 Tax=Ohtaekwangia sp. TaxID=2066019 RepID=UPI002F92FE97
MKKIYSLLFASATVLAISSCSDDTVRVSQVSLNSNAMTLFIGEDSTLTATITPGDAENKNLTWTSSSTAVATIDADGKITAVSPGTTTITVTATDNTDKTATCTVTVANGYLYNSERNEIKSSVYGNYTTETGGGYQFWFFPTVEDDGTFDDANEYIWIDIPKEMMGTTFQLTEENNYDWGWWIEYSINNGETFYQGFGSPDEMENVVSGTMRADITGTNSFTVTFDILFDDGKTLKGTYSGTMPENEDYYGGGRVEGRKAFNRGNF